MTALAITDWSQLSHLWTVRWNRANQPPKVFYLSEDYLVTLRINGVLVPYTVPKGYGTDFASIPRVARMIPRQPPHAYAEAAVLHDWLCSSRDPMGSAAAAAVFELGLRQYPWIWDYERVLMYQAVLRFGPTWD